MGSFSAAPQEVFPKKARVIVVSRIDILLLTVLNLSVLLFIVCQDDKSLTAMLVILVIVCSVKSVSLFKKKR